MRVLLTFEKYKTTNYDISGMRRYCRNILQWNKNNMKSTKMTNGDYYVHYDNPNFSTIFHNVCAHAFFNNNDVDGNLSTENPTT